jgi:uncharacterized protein YciI
MPVVVRCLYRPGGAEARLHIRDVHIQYMIGHRRLINTGGALMADDGQTPIGMFLILESESRASVEAFMSEEPYTRAGLFESRTIELLDRFVPHEDPEFSEKLLLAAGQWIVDHGEPRRISENSQ